ncbi:uncharacterized protein LOC121383159 [Gigantopelta aegis]|uniref:uncharacterized protein LOC121383159 n=1 Tax=Gigantopelta aegis TaxID=1735272 RepID=UPI001B88C190|nr:uncharacterized protein LOC121383159 [Gigantopelta aegis]
MCQAGQFSSNGIKPCKACPVGKYQPHAGKTTCLLCDVGKTTSKTYSKSAKSCKFFDMVMKGPTTVLSKRGLASNVDDLTISFWMEVKSADGDIVIKRPDGTLLIQISFGAVFKVNFLRNSISNLGTLTSSWVHLCLVYSHKYKMLTIYKNGFEHKVQRIESDYSPVFTSGTALRLDLRTSSEITIRSVFVISSALGSIDVKKLANFCGSKPLRFAISIADLIASAAPTLFHFNMPSTCKVFGQWERWGLCSRSCGGGIRLRKRNCNLPAAMQVHCNNSDNQTAACNSEPCKECFSSDIREGIGSSSQCTFNNKELSCIAVCRNPNYVIDVQDKSVLKCRRGKWDPESAELASCTMAAPPISLKIIASGTLNGPDCLPKSAVDKLISAIANNSGYLHCIKTALCNSTVNLQSKACKKTNRVSRSTGTPVTLTLRATIPNIDLKLGEFMQSKRVTPELQKLIEAIIDMERSAQELKKNLSVFNVTFKNRNYYSHPKDITMRADVECPQGAAARNMLCVYCSPGTYFEDGDCHLCTTNMYQNEMGKTECKECPTGSTQFNGTASAELCKVSATDVPEDTAYPIDYLDVLVGVAVAVVSLLVTMGIIFLFYMKFCRSKAHKVESTDTDIKAETQTATIKTIQPHLVASDRPFPWNDKTGAAFKKDIGPIEVIPEDTFRTIPKTKITSPTHPTHSLGTTSHGSKSSHSSLGKTSPHMHDRHDSAHHEVTLMDTHLMSSNTHPVSPHTHPVSPHTHPVSPHTHPVSPHTHPVSPPVSPHRQSIPKSSNDDLKSGYVPPKTRYIPGGSGS